MNLSLEILINNLKNHDDCTVLMCWNPKRSTGKQQIDNDGGGGGGNESKSSNHHSASSSSSSSSSSSASSSSSSSSFSTSSLNHARHIRNMKISMSVPLVMTWFFEKNYVRMKKVTEEVGEALVWYETQSAAVGGGGGGGGGGGSGGGGGGEGEGKGEGDKGQVALLSPMFLDVDGRACRLLHTFLSVAVDVGTLLVTTNDDLKKKNKNKKNNNKKKKVGVDRTTILTVSERMLAIGRELKELSGCFTQAMGMIGQRETTPCLEPASVSLLSRFVRQVRRNLFFSSKSFLFL